MQPAGPAKFYTGLVAELYSSLRSADPDPEPYARFVGRTGEPALELGCGDGDPLLELRRRGLAVEGLDSSPDMLQRCRARANARRIDVVLHESPIETMDLGRRFRSIYLAGPTFNLIPDDETARRAFEQIRLHLEPTGAALIPLFVPDPVMPDQLGRFSEHTTEAGTLYRCTTVSVHRDETERLQRVVLRYERISGDETSALDREWVLHWYSKAGFRALVAAAGLHVRAVLGNDGRPAAETAQQVGFIVGPAGLKRTGSDGDSG